MFALADTLQNLLFRRRPGVAGDQNQAFMFDIDNGCFSQAKRSETSQCFYFS
jgi:hypothetical protein